MLPIPDRRFRIQFAKLLGGVGGGRFDFFVIRRRNTNKKSATVHPLRQERAARLHSHLNCYGRGKTKNQNSCFSSLFGSERIPRNLQGAKLCRMQTYAIFLHNMYMTRKLAQLQGKAMKNHVHA
jgi:hypothetical protein